MTKDAEFEAYFRLLRQQGVGLGKLPRVPSITFETLHDFQTTHSKIEDLAREVVPTRTGLKLPELENGYAMNQTVQCGVNYG